MNTFSYRKGFTLLETMAATAILAFVIIGPLATIVNSSSYARKTKDTMTATYLAEGTVELLQNRYDSIYVLCRKLPDDPACAPLSPTESSSQIAWRLFKGQLIDNLSGQPSCFINDPTPASSNPLGCSFDSLDMLSTPTSTPTRYVGNSPECSSLVDVAITDTVTPPEGSQAGGNGISNVNASVRHSYRCNGVAGRIPTGASTSTKSFNRTVVLERIPASFESALPFDQQYNDDIRIVSKVEFKTFRNSTTSVMITRFMHAHQ